MKSNSEKSKAISEQITDLYKHLRDGCDATFDMIPFFVKGADIYLDKLKEDAKSANEKLAGIAKEIKDISISDEISIRRIAKSSGKTKHVNRFLYQLIPVNIASCVEVFFSGAAKVALKSNPDRIKASQKTYTASEILNLRSMPEVVDMLIETEVHRLLYKSLIDQVVEVEKIAGVSLDVIKKKPDFFELFLRRNIYLHNAGIVNEVYLNGCSSVGFSREDGGTAVLGEVIGIGKEYFKRSYASAISACGLISYLLWLKLDDRSRDEADKFINNAGYELLVEYKYDAAQQILEFVFRGLDKIKDDATKRMIVINYANCMRLQGEDNKAKEILAKLSWTAASDAFLLAESVIKEDYSSSCNLMKKIGSKGEVTQFAYCEWPLFRKFNKTPEFLKTFAEIFGQDYDAVASARDIGNSPQFLALASSGASEVQVESARIKVPRNRQAKRPTKGRAQTNPKRQKVH